MKIPSLNTMTDLPLGIAVVVAFFLGGWSLYQRATPDDLFTYCVLYVAGASSGIVLFLIGIHLIEKLFNRQQAK